MRNLLFSPLWAILSASVVSAADQKILKDADKGKVHDLTMETFEPFIKSHDLVLAECE